MGISVFFHKDFYRVYTSDPAAAAGRMEAIVEELSPYVPFVEPVPAAESDIASVHSRDHIAWVRSQGLYDIAALAAGGAVGAAEAGMKSPAFALICPPGHHASSASAWGFCYFNNMAVALTRLKRSGKIQSAFVLDFDLHFGDGNVNILGPSSFADVYNPEHSDRDNYLLAVRKRLGEYRVDMIGVSAGFDNHRDDWGSLLITEDYFDMGCWVREAAERNQGGCFGILEGGYNHGVLGSNVLAFVKGLDPG